MMLQLQEIWDGHIGRVGDVKNGLEIDTPDGRPTHWAKYRAGQKERKLEKEEKDIIKKMVVI